MDSIELEQYMSSGVERIIGGIMKSAVKNPRESLYMIKHSPVHKKARIMREAAEKEGEHIPPFLIASITSQCNLHCKGCYARANHSCTDHVDLQELMTSDEWKTVFNQAGDMGIEFILLAGGEPLLRKDVLEAAGEDDQILFPIFTNGTMMSDDYINFFKAHPNLIPILSIEGAEETTDTRRGAGTYKRITGVMQTLHAEGILQGASVTVSKSNIKEVLSDDFVENLKKNGTSGIIYVEYVPVDASTQALAPDDDARSYMTERMDILRKKYEDMLFVSFPGDEKTSGGCLAAGRGFFHINANGSAEPCPFSPYSDTNLRNTTLRDALRSPLFVKLQERGNLTETHVGGCTLYEQRQIVETYVKEHT